VNYLPFDRRRENFASAGEVKVPLNLSVLGQAQDQQQVDTLYNPHGAVLAGPATVRSQCRARFAATVFRYHQRRLARAIWKQTIVSVETAGDANGHRELAFETRNPGRIGGVVLLQYTRRQIPRCDSLPARHTFEKRRGLLSFTRSRENTDQRWIRFWARLYFAPQQGAPAFVGRADRALSWGTVRRPCGQRFRIPFEYRTGYPFSVGNQGTIMIGAPNRLRFPTKPVLT